MTYFFRLPCDLIRYVVGEWLEIQDIVQLDTSVNKSRCILSDALNYVNILLPKEHPYISSLSIDSKLINFYLWSMKRGILLKSLSVIPCAMGTIELLRCDYVRQLNMKGVDYKQAASLINLCPCLETLNFDKLSYCSDQNVPVFDETCIANLRHFHLQNCLHTQELIDAVIKCCTKLEVFTLCHSYYTIDFDCIILNNPLLHTLSVEPLNSVDYNHLLHLINDLRHISNVSIASSFKWNAVLVSNILRKKSITRFRIVSPFQFFDTVQSELSYNHDKVNNVRHLYLIGTNLSSDFMACLSSLNINELHFSNLITLTDDVLLSGCRVKLPSLRRLDISKCFNISPLALRSFLCAAENLQFLVLKNITEEGLCTVLCPALPSWENVFTWDKIREDTVVSIIETIKYNKYLGVCTNQLKEKELYKLAVSFGVDIKFMSGPVY